MGPSEETKVAPSLLLRGLRPLGRQHRTLPCHPLTTRGRYPSSHTLPRGGSMHQTPRKFGRAQTADPAEFSWCRARDLNPHGKPIRPSSVRVCQFRQPGTDPRDHYTAPVRSPARRVMKSELLDYCRKKVRYVEEITNRIAPTAVSRVKNVSLGRGPWNIRALPPIAPSPSPFGPCSRMTPMTKNASTKWNTRIAVLTLHLRPALAET